MTINILGVESSCDETAASVIQDGRLLSNVVYSQSVHEFYGGVVPELASRAHQRQIIPVVHSALHKAEITLNELSAIAYTRGPGLMGSLLVGVSFSKAMAASLGIPVIGINHLQAHIMALFIGRSKPEFPFLCLTVSGGHTQLVRVDDFHKMHILGESIDDAAGEAFDKTAKLLGLPYPGGHLIDQIARDGNPLKFLFPETQMKDYDFSFSGLKTAALYFLREKVQQDSHFIENHLADICASLQYRIVGMLLSKLEKAAIATGIRQVAIAGGVSANSNLRDRLNILGERYGWKTYIPPAEFCTDNAAMIAMAGYRKFTDNQFSDLYDVPEARMKF